MKTKILILGLICLLIFTPLFAQEKSKEPTPLQIYVTKAKQTPLTFKVPKEKEEEVWGRIQSFIAKYSSMKIQIATDYVVETYTPLEVKMGDPKWPGANFGYEAVKTPMGDEVEFEVKCVTGDPSGYCELMAGYNAHYLAHYALTGEIKEKAIKRK